MEKAGIVRAAEAAVLTGVSVLALSACGDSIAGELEYHPDGTASRIYYERVDQGENLPPEKGDVKSKTVYECIETAPGARFVLVTSRDATGSILEETSHTSTACRDDLRIIAPEIP